MICEDEQSSKEGVGGGGGVAALTGEREEVPTEPREVDRGVGGGKIEK